MWLVRSWLRLWLGVQYEYYCCTTSSSLPYYRSSTRINSSYCYTTTAVLSMKTAVKVLGRLNPRRYSRQRQRPANPQLAALSMKLFTFLNIDIISNSIILASYHRIQQYNIHHSPCRRVDRGQNTHSRDTAHHASGRSCYIDNSRSVTLLYSQQQSALRNFSVLPALVGRAGGVAGILFLRLNFWFLVRCSASICYLSKYNTSACCASYMYLCHSHHRPRLIS